MSSAWLLLWSRLKAPTWSTYPKAADGNFHLSIVNPNMNAVASGWLLRLFLNSLGTRSWRLSETTPIHRTILLVWTWGSWASCSEHLLTVHYWAPWCITTLDWTSTQELERHSYIRCEYKFHVLVPCHAWVGSKSSVLQPCRSSLLVDQNCSKLTEWEEITPKAQDWASWRWSFWSFNTERVRRRDKL